MVATANRAATLGFDAGAIREMAARLAAIHDTRIIQAFRELIRITEYAAGLTAAALLDALIDEIAR